MWEEALTEKDLEGRAEDFSLEFPSIKEKIDLLFLFLIVVTTVVVVILTIKLRIIPIWIEFSKSNAVFKVVG